MPKDVFEVASTWIELSISNEMYKSGIPLQTDKNATISDILVLIKNNVCHLSNKYLNSDFMTWITLMNLDLQYMELQDVRTNKKNRRERTDNEWIIANFEMIALHQPQYVLQLLKKMTFNEKRMCNDQFNKIVGNVPREIIDFFANE